MSLPALGDIRIGIIGLGYVGLPLAVYLARHFPVIGFDIDASRIEELRKGIDRTREVTAEEFAAATRSNSAPTSPISSRAISSSSRCQPPSIRPSGPI